MSAASQHAAQGVDELRNDAIVLAAPLQTSQLCLRSPLQTPHVTARFICACSHKSVSHGGMAGRRLELFSSFLSSFTARQI